MNDRQTDRLPIVSPIYSLFILYRGSDPLIFHKFFNMYGNILCTEICFNTHIKVTSV